MMEGTGGGEMLESDGGSDVFGVGQCTKEEIRPLRIKKPSN